MGLEWVQEPILFNAGEAAAVKVGQIAVGIKSGSVLTLGVKDTTAYAKCDGTLTQASMVSMLGGVEQVGDLEVEVYVNGGKISASEPIALSSASEVINTALTGWTKPFSTGDKFTFKIIGTPSVVQNVDIALRYDKTGV